LSRIRNIEIRNFRCIREFSWWPSPGINCLVGPGDVGKSSILDAIDLCLGARRTIQFTDADFFNLDVGTPVSITITIGELDDSLKNMEAYGNFLRSCNTETRIIEDEPEKDCETVLTLRLTVAGDLEPVWSLVSDRAAAQSQTRNLNWTDRLRLSPTRIAARSCRSRASISPNPNIQTRKAVEPHRSSKCIKATTRAAFQYLPPG
jgi:putative ATP-dependent endonuclease of the OLD family